MSALETTEYRGGAVELHYDEDGYASNPRDWCNLSRFACPTMREYVTPQEVDGFDFGDFEYEDDEDEHYPRQGEELAAWAERILRAECGALYVESFALHGVECFAIVTAESVAECGTAPEHFHAAIRAEVDVYRAWCEGEVYGWVAKDARGEVLESCWGYVGSSEHDYMESEARAAIDAWVEERERLAEDIAADSEAAYAHA